MGSSTKGKGIPFLSAIEDEYELNKGMAKASEADSRYEAAQRRIMGEKLMKQQIAQYGASGVELEGTPRAQIQADLAEAEIEAMNIIYSGKLKSAEMKYRAKLNKNNAYMSLAKDGAMMAFSAGAFSKAGAPASSGGFHKASTGTNGFTISGGGTGGSNIA